jgi:hypothetical protein
MVAAAVEGNPVHPSDRVLICRHTVPMKVQLEKRLLSCIRRGLPVQSGQAQGLDQSRVVEAEEMLETLGVSLVLHVVRRHDAHFCYARFRGGPFVGDLPTQGTRMEGAEGLQAHA